MTTVDAKSYLGVLHDAYRRHYTERTDVWTDDLAMRCVPPLVQGRLKLAPSARVLDIGCGSGRDVAYFSHIVAAVVGIDILPHPDWDEIVEEHGPRVRFSVGDFLSYRSTERYDLVLDNGCFHHQHEADHTAYLEKAGEILSPGGWFVISTFKNPALDEFIDGNGRIHKYFGNGELHDKLAAAGFEVTAEIEIYRVVKQDAYRLSFCRRRRSRPRSEAQ